MGSGFRDTSRLAKLKYLGLEFEKSFRSCIWTIFLPQRVEVELIVVLEAAASEIWTDIQNCHVWAWNLEFENKVPEAAYGYSFYQWGGFNLFLLYMQWFPSYRPIDFQANCILHIGKLHMCSLYPRGSQLTLFSLYEKAFSRYGPIFKIFIFGQEIWNLKKGAKDECILAFYRIGSKLKGKGNGFIWT